MNGWRKLFDTTGGSGQSLLEVALFMPILIFVLAGIVEVTNLLNTQNRVTTASRVGAGFGASNFEHGDWAGTAAAMGQVTRNTVTETLDIDPDLWDIWSVHAVTNEDGDDFEIFTHTQVYGNNSVVTLGEWSTMATVVRQDVLNALTAECGGGNTACSGNVEVVASVPFHNIDTILGLPLWQWTGLSRIRGLTVMRVGQFEDNTGCPILPITLQLDQYSLYPTNWPTPPPPMHNTENISFTWYLSDTIPIFPDSFGSQMTHATPYYVNTVTPPAYDTDMLGGNAPGVWLPDARRGYVYFAREGFGEGNFGWLTWRGSPSQQALDSSLDPPGDFLNETTGYPGSPADTNSVGNGTYGPTGDGDGYLIPGEWIEGSEGNINVLRDWMQYYMDEDIHPTILVHDYDNELNGANRNFHVVGFMTVKLLGYKFQGNEKWLVFEVDQWPARKCAPPQPPAYP